MSPLSQALPVIGLSPVAHNGNAGLVSVMAISLTALSTYAVGGRRCCSLI